MGLVTAGVTFSCGRSFFNSAFKHFSAAHLLDGTSSTEADITVVASNDPPATGATVLEAPVLAGAPSVAPSTAA